MMQEIEIEGSYKEDVTRIVAKIKEYKNEKKDHNPLDLNPWSKLNDGVRMAITVPTPKDAFRISKDICKVFLGGETP
jgi:hypothetical protein